MKNHRKIVVYIASADGCIARPDGDVAWLKRPRPKGNYGMDAFLKSADAILGDAKPTHRESTKALIAHHTRTCEATFAVPPKACDYACRKQSKKGSCQPEGILFS